jgi:hypothetical protein
MTNLTTHRSAQDVQPNIHKEINTCPESFISEEVETLEEVGLRVETPFIRRVSGIRLPHDQSPKDLVALEELVGVDIHRTTPGDDTFIDGVTNLIQTIFPDDKLPILPSNNLLNQLALYDKKQGKWKLPDYEKENNEDNLTAFLNQICDNIEKITETKALRKWNSNFCNTPLEGSPISRKPDIVLLDVASKCRVTWTSIRAIFETTSQKYETRKISNTVTDKSYIILTTQPNRIFVPILSIWGAFNLRLTVTDRQGQLRSQVVDIGRPWRSSDSLTFLRLIIGFCFADSLLVGYDPTMRTTYDDKVEFISCDGKEFKVIDVLFEAQSLVGRGTRVWLVEYQGKRYILKDSWVEVSRHVSEFKCLEDLKGIKGVAQLFCGADVCIDGVLLTTGFVRNGGSWGDQKRSRVRQRVVLSSIGDHIATFRSRKELIAAFRDIASSM